MKGIKMSMFLSVVPSCVISAKTSFHFNTIPEYYLVILHCKFKNIKFEYLFSGCS
jgi:hypothetical protein